MNNYIISPISTYCHEDLLWYTKIGEKSGEMTLLCSVAGKSVAESREKASWLLGIIELGECQRAEKAKLPTIQLNV